MTTTTISVTYTPIGVKLGLTQIELHIIQKKPVGTI